MKKITFLLFSALMLTLSWQVNAQINEGFETDPPAGWTFMQTEVDDPGFVQTSARANSGTYSFYHNDDNIATSSTSWMISPALSVVTGDILSFFHNHNYETYGEENGIWISTASADPIANPGDFTLLYDLLANLSEDAWTEYTQSLDAYNGMTVYFAFKYSGDWEDELYIDDFFAGTPPTNTPDWANIQWITDGVNGSNTTLTLDAWTSVSAYAQVYEPGVTDAVGQGAGIECWIGADGADTDPSTWTEDAWEAIAYFGDSGNNDEYKFDAVLDFSGTVYVATRWRIDGGPYVYGGYNGPWDGTTNKSIELIVNPIVANDDCSGAETLTVNADLACTIVTPGTTVDATRSESDEQNCFGNANDDVWFSFVATSETHAIEISNVVAVSGTSTDMYFEVLEGTCGSLTSLLCSDNNSNSVSGLTVSNTYLIRVYSYSDTSSQTFDLCVGTPPPPIPGEVCSDPIVVSALPYNTSDDTANYGDDYENGSSDCSAYYMSGDDVVYSFTPSADGTFNISLTNIGSTYSGIHVLDGCIDATPTCVGFEGNSGSADRVFDVSLTGGTTYYIVISTWATPQSTTYTLDITEVLCANPSAMTATGVTTTTADLTWTAGGTETDWNIEYLADVDFTPGTGAPGVIAYTATGTPDYNASGLTQATTYYVYYQANCGGETSEWVGPFIGTTLCDAVADFSENFDSVSTPDLPNCWSSIVDNGASSFAYVETSTSADNTAPNGVSLYNSSSVSTSNIMLVSPILSNLNGGTHRLTFLGSNSSATQDVEVGTLTDPADGSTFTVLETVDLTMTHTAYIVDFSGYTGSDQYIAFRRLSTSTYTYVYLDDIVWEMIPVGPPNCSTISSPADLATGISSMPALSWSTNVDATGYKLKIGTTDGGAEFLTETDLGDVTSYDVMSAMAYSTMYYVTLTPYNANGDAVSCASTSFTTTANPNYGGGPDGVDPNNLNSGGYFFANDTPDATAAPSQPTYSWIDPVAAGHTEITSWTAGTDDDGHFSIPDIGFDFDFYGNTYRTGDIHINSNGAIFFGVADGYTNDIGSSVSIPDVSDNYSNFIAGCWQDLDDSTDGIIYYGGTSDRFVVTWWHYIDYGDSAEYITFQIILYPSGNIVIQYNDTESTTDELGDSDIMITILGDALIGIENSTEDKGVQYRNNGSGGPIFGSPLALGFTTTSGSLSVEGVTSFEGFKYFPNPVNDNLSLRAQNNIQNVSVLNMLGQEVLRVAPHSISSEVDMSALNAGAYFVKVTINDTTETIKIIRK